MLGTPPKNQVKCPTPSDHGDKSIRLGNPFPRKLAFGEPLCRLAGTLPHVQGVWDRQGLLETLSKIVDSRRMEAWGSVSDAVINESRAGSYP